MSCSARGQFAQDLVIAVPRRTRDESDLEAATVRLLHDFDAGPVVTIEDRNTLCQRFIAGAVPCSLCLAGEFVGEEVEFCHDCQPCSLS